MSEHWFYRTLGQEMGPVSLETIQELIRAEVLGQGDEFRYGDGPWHDYSEKMFLLNPPQEPKRNFPEGQCDDQFLPESTERIASFRPPPDTQRVDKLESGIDHAAITQALIECRKQLHYRDARQIKRRSLEERSILGAALSLLVPLMISFRTIGTLSASLSRIMIPCLRVLRSKLVWGPILILLLCGAALVVSAKWTTQSDAYDFLHGSLQKIHALRENNAKADEWANFTRQTTAELDRLLPKLQRSAKADNPGSLELLWAARDYLPVILRSLPAQNQEAEEKFALHMKMAGQMIGPPGPSSILNWMVTGIVLTDASLLIVAVLWWWRSLRSEK